MNPPSAARSLPPTAADALSAAVVVPWLVFVATQIEPGADNRAVDALGWACIVVAGGALALRRRQPLAVVVVVTAALAVHLGRGYPGGPVYLTLFVAIHSVAGAVDRRVAFAIAAVASSVLVVTGVVTHRGPGLAHLVFVGWTAAAVFLGDAVRSRRQSVAALEQVCDWLVVIDAGALVYQGPASGFLGRATAVVAMEPEGSSDLGRLAGRARAEGHQADRDGSRLLVPVDTAGGADPRSVALSLNRAAIAEGVVVAELVVRRPTLESEYLAVVEGARS